MNVKTTLMHMLSFKCSCLTLNFTFNASMLLHAAALYYCDHYNDVMEILEKVLNWEQEVASSFWVWAQQQALGWGLCTMQGYALRMTRRWRRPSVPLSAGEQVTLWTEHNYQQITIFTWQIASFLQNSSEVCHPFRLWCLITASVTTHWW